MDNKWEKFCEKISGRKFDSEQQYEDTLVDYFELLFGWTLDRQVQIQMGHSIKRADIILKHNGESAIIIEVKRPDKQIDEEAAGQLRSYMRQKHVEFGLLIGEKISVYFDDYNNRKADPIKVQEISFKADSEKGKKLGEVLDYDSYSEDRMRAFCQDLLKELDIKKSALQLIDKLTSQDGKDILSKALINSDVSEQYNEPAIKMALEEINIIRKQSARGESPKISRPTERKARKAKIADPKPLNGIKETYVEDYSDMTPGKAKIICMNREVHLNDNITFASLNKNEKTYWANPKIEFLGVNWSIILNDKKNRRLHIFNIPAGTISKNQVKVRNDQPGKMDMDILYDDKAFKDIKSGVEFVQWFAETIQY